MMVLVGSAVTNPRALHAQQKAMAVTGFLGTTSPGPFAPFVAAFLRGLSESGYVEGETWRSNTIGRRIALIGCLHWPPTSSDAKSM
jgi:hypothetical protein